MTHETRRAQPMASVEPMMTLDDLAAMIQLTKPSLYCLRHAGKGPVAYRVGRQLRFRREDVDVWLESRRDEPSVVA